MPTVRRQGHAPFGQHVLFSDIPEILVASRAARHPGVESPRHLWCVLSTAKPRDSTRPLLHLEPLERAPRAKHVTRILSAFPLIRPRQERLEDREPERLDQASGRRAPKKMARSGARSGLSPSVVARVFATAV
jgi:hypothetical protein